MKKQNSLIKQLIKRMKTGPFSSWSREWKAFSFFMACVVVFCTTYSLILPAISMELDVAQEMDGVYLDDGRLTGDGFSEDAVDSVSGDTELFISDTDVSDLADEGEPVVEEPGDFALGEAVFDDGGMADLPGDVLVTDDNLETGEEAPEDLVNSLKASASGVDVSLTYAGGVPADTEVSFELIDPEDPEQVFDNYLYGAAEEISKVYPDWSVVAVDFWHVESTPAFEVGLELGFYPAVYADGQAVYDFEMNGPLVYEDGRPVYYVQGLAKGIETGKVLLIDWSDAAWHLYDPVQIETMEDGIVKISTDTESLTNGAAVFGVVVLEEKNNGELDILPEGETSDEEDVASGEDTAANTAVEDTEVGEATETRETTSTDEETAAGEATEAGEDTESGESSSTEENPSTVQTDNETQAETVAVAFNEGGAESEDETTTTTDAEENADAVDNTETVESEDGTEGTDETETDTVGESESEATGVEEPEEVEATDETESEAEAETTGESETETEEDTKSETESQTEGTTEDGTNTEGEEEPEEKPETEQIEAESLPAAAVEDYVVEIPGEDYVLHVSYGEDAGIPADPVIVAVPVEDQEYAAQAIEEVKSVVEEGASSTENTSATANTSVTDVTENIEVGENSAHNDGSDEEENFENEWTEEDSLEETEVLTEVEQDTTTTPIDTTDQLKLVGLFDLTIYHDGNVIQPQAPITVSVEFKSGLAENEQIYAVHFPGTGEQPEEETEKLTEDSAAEDSSANLAMSDDADDTEISAGVDESEKPVDFEGSVDKEPFINDAVDELDEAPLADHITLQEENDPEPEQAEIIVPETEPVDTTLEVIVAETMDDNTAVFTTDSLSYIAIVSYTVDFHWNVDGKEFSFSIPGGGYTTFTEIVRILGIANADSGDEAEQPSEENIRKFIEDVADVEFSSPELLSVSKVEEKTTIGEIKDRLGLECEYSAELTEGEIEEINGSEVEAVDWALISLKAFTSEESLTVTMKDGESFEIRVTDATYPYHVRVNDTLAGTFSNKNIESTTTYDGSVATADLHSGITAAENAGYRYVGWYNEKCEIPTTADGVTQSIDGKVLQNSTDVSIEHTFIACFVPNGSFLVLINDESCSSALTYSGAYKNVNNETSLPKYCYSTDTLTITAKNPQYNNGPIFLGWYNGDELLSTSLTYTVGNETSDIVLTPKYGNAYNDKDAKSQCLCLGEPLSFLFLDN